MEKMLNVSRFTYKNLQFEVEDFLGKYTGQMNIGDLLELCGDSLDALHYYDSYNKAVSV